MALSHRQTLASIIFGSRCYKCVQVSSAQGLQPICPLSTCFTDLTLWCPVWLSEYCVWMKLSLWLLSNFHFKWGGSWEKKGWLLWDYRKQIHNSWLRSVICLEELGLRFAFISSSCKIMGKETNGLHLPLLVAEITTIF